MPRPQRQVYPHLFQDSDGNGNGDLRWLISRAGQPAVTGDRRHLAAADLRVPMSDGGYDVADYCAIDPIFGSIDELIALAHERGIGVQRWSC